MSYLRKGNIFFMNRSIAFCFILLLEGKVFSSNIRQLVFNCLMATWLSACFMITLSDVSCNFAYAFMECMFCTGPF